MINVTILPFISSHAYSSGDEASDYMIDQIYHGFSSLTNVIVQQLPQNPLMFQECDKTQLNKVWGRGFTLYSLLPSPTQNFPIEDSDLIIVPLHHTMVRYQREYYNFITDVIRIFNKPTIAVDGWDQQEYSEETASLCKYFKRELTDDKTSAFPIFFAIPEVKFNWHKNEKKYDFSPMVPANFSWEPCEHLKTYIYSTEEEYYEQYQQSYFGYLTKKGGVQTGRTLELIANDCFPFFTDIELYPKNTMHNFPKELCIEVKKMKGVYPGTIIPYNPEKSTYIGDTRQIKPGNERGYIDFDIFDINLYNIYLNEIKKICWSTMTTKQLAKYILEESL